MDFIDVFALIVLVVLFAAAVGLWVILGMLPGKIARQRQHAGSAAADRNSTSRRDFHLWLVGRDHAWLAHADRVHLGAYGSPMARERT